MSVTPEAIISDVTTILEQKDELTFYNPVTPLKNIIIIGSCNALLTHHQAINWTNHDYYKNTPRNMFILNFNEYVKDFGSKIQWKFCTQQY